MWLASKPIYLYIHVQTALTKKFVPFEYVTKYARLYTNVLQAMVNNNNCTRAQCFGLWSYMYM